MKHDKSILYIRLNSLFCSLFVGLVAKKSGCLDFDLLLAHIRNAWKAKNEVNLIAYMKLATMVSLYFNITFYLCFISNNKIL